MGNKIKKGVLAALLVLLAASAILPIAGHPFAHTSASSDPIAVGNWYQDQYDAIIVQYANSYGLNPFLVKGQIMLESGFNTYAVSQQVNSACGWTHDEGLMQINPYCSGTGSANLFNPWANIQIGTETMSSLYHEFGNYNLALQAYNIGANAVANGQRNWAYSNEVNSYAQQFESEHASLYGGGSGSTYTVQSGDTLYSIGQRFGVSWQSIASSNGIYYPYYVYIGQQLTIPGTTGGAGGSTYTVQYGDTLYSIGQRFGVSWQSIASSNGIYYPYYIHVGEQLNIP